MERTATWSFLPEARCASYGNFFNGDNDMKQLSREDLFSLEEYAVKRSDYRNEVMAHKKNRHVRLGPNATLYFEDRLTIQYQIQEMLRIEKIFEADGIREELEAYNPLIPDGANWKATFMLEYPDVEERRVALAGLVGVEEKIWVQIGEFSKVYPIADEDLERDNEHKTSSVHFVRFELSPEMVAAAKQGEVIRMGCDHDNLDIEVAPIPEGVRASLVADLD